MRSKEERQAVIKEKMQRQRDRKQKGGKSGYQGEKAQNFKDNYTDDVKKAVGARRKRQGRNQYSDAQRQDRQDGRKQARAIDRMNDRQALRKSERAGGMTAAEQREKSKAGGYRN